MSAAALCSTDEDAAGSSKIQKIVPVEKRLTTKAKVAKVDLASLSVVKNSLRQRKLKASSPTVSSSAASQTRRKLPESTNTASFRYTSKAKKLPVLKTPRKQKPALLKFSLPVVTEALDPVVLPTSPQVNGDCIVIDSSPSTPSVDDLLGKAEISASVIMVDLVSPDMKVVTSTSLSVNGEQLSTPLLPVRQSFDVTLLSIWPDCKVPHASPSLMSTGGGGSVQNIISDTVDLSCGSASGGAAMMSKQWECTICTFLNEGDFDLCEMCDHAFGSTTPIVLTRSPQTSLMPVSAASSLMLDNPHETATAKRKQEDPLGNDTGAKKLRQTPTPCSSKVATTWYCSICTFENLTKCRDCECCGFPFFEVLDGDTNRKNAVLQEDDNRMSIDTTNIVKSTWSCEFCTFVNHRMETLCECCMNSRSSVAVDIGAVNTVNSKVVQPVIANVIPTVPVRVNSNSSTVFKQSSSTTIFKSDSNMGISSKNLGAVPKQIFNVQKTSTTALKTTMSSYSNIASKPHATLANRVASATVPKKPATSNAGSMIKQTTSSTNLKTYLANLKSVGSAISTTSSKCAGRVISTTSLKSVSAVVAATSVSAPLISVAVTSSSPVVVSALQSSNLASKASITTQMPVAVPNLVVPAVIPAALLNVALPPQVVPVTPLPPPKSISSASLIPTQLKNSPENAKASATVPSLNQSNSNSASGVKNVFVSPAMSAAQFLLGNVLAKHPSPAAVASSTVATSIVSSVPVATVVQSKSMVQPEEPGWNCQRCTFRNHDDIVECECCSLKRFYDASEAPHEDTHALKLPCTWSVQDSNTPMRRVMLDPNSPEYLKVFQNANKTARGSIKLIRQIERIENARLYTHYALSRSQMLNRELYAEKQLWHGTAADTVSKICCRGFNRSYCGKNATAFGKGVYFAQEFAYSANPIYSPPDVNKLRYVFQCSVLTGYYTVGNQAYIEPPVKNSETGELYDSVVDKVNSPSIFVIFHDSRAYPEYLISFQ